MSAVAGEAAFQYVKKAIGLAMAGEVDATVTNALNKEALNPVSYTHLILTRTHGHG